MHDRIIPTLFLSLSTLAIAPFIVPAIAYQQFANRDRVDATIHFSSHNSPAAGRPSATQFLLTEKNDQPVSLANCNCQISVRDFRDRVILHNLPLSSSTREGKAAIATELTFPTSGSYTVVLSGQTQSSEPFELRFPVTAIDAKPTY
ncbi:hypothetical protein H6F67_04490 [Microcoleus sp. FACHB-1515]|uniref:hypothetical protein n=1 Tax=Cyanophyceae TaxID=3028117 RepID=UPI001689335B|nr:hypothetical protein [Microcoleus sp. FACHB-1515]MBD2089112.1 hypothetical protein [Microcoleus sp. FACHB-1515]